MSHFLALQKEVESSDLPPGDNERLKRAYIYKAVRAVLGKHYVLPRCLHLPPLSGLLAIMFYSEKVLFRHLTCRSYICLLELKLRARKSGQRLDQHRNLLSSVSYIWVSLPLTPNDSTLILITQSMRSSAIWKIQLL